MGKEGGAGEREASKLPSSIRSCGREMGWVRSGSTSRGVGVLSVVGYGSVSREWSVFVAAQLRQSKSARIQQGRSHDTPSTLWMCTNLLFHPLAEPPLLLRSPLHSGLPSPL